MSRGQLETYIIELKLYAHEAHHEAMTQVVKQHARDMLASALLLSPDKSAFVAARTSNEFYNHTCEIEVFESSAGMEE